MKVFGIFEGGGVRGYAHVGALRAIQRRGIEFEAVAGTSIGAIIACFIAAGCTATELLDINAESEFGIAALTPSEVFSKADFKTVRKISKDLERLDLVRRFMKKLKLPSPMDFKNSLIVAVTIWATIPLFWAASPFMYLRHRRGLKRLWGQFGLADTGAVHTWLDSALRSKLGIEDRKRPLIFSDLKIPLRVIVSDVAGGAMHVLGGDGDDLLVESVLASAAFPLFFIPDGRGGRSLVDGGILSNLPAWVFDRQRDAAPVCVPTIAFRLVPRDGNEAPAMQTLARFLPRLLGTMLDGARELQFRRIDDHHLVQIPVGIDVLAFDEMEKQRSHLVQQGDDAVEDYFRENVGPIDPVKATMLLKELAAHVRQLLATTAHVRAWVLVPANEEFLRVAYSANMNQDADDQLLIRRSSLGAASVFLRKEPVLINLAELAAAAREDPYHKYEHALRSQSARFACALPIFADPEDWSRGPDRRADPVAVLGVDLDEDARLLFLSETVEDRLATYAQIIGERLRDRAVEKFSTRKVRKRTSMGSTLTAIGPGVEIYQRKLRSLIFDESSDRLARAIPGA